MLTFNVKTSYEVPSKKGSKTTKAVSKTFDSTVFDTDKRIVSKDHKQVLQTMFLVYSADMGFIWVDASDCKLIPLAKKK